MPVFTIDGSIGCGKSTVLEYLHTNYGMPIDTEPVKKWTPYLENMYKENKGAFEFQVRVWLDRCWIQPKANVNIVMERSPHFQKNVFIPISLNMKRISDTENCMLHEMYYKCMQMWSPKGYIYLRSNPDKCYERINKRGRGCEQPIDIDYLNQLHEYHEQVYMWAAAHGMPIICIDVENKPVSTIAAEVWNALHILGMTANTQHNHHNHRKGHK